MRTHQEWANGQVVTKKRAEREVINSGRVVKEFRRTIKPMFAGYYHAPEVLAFCDAVTA